MIAMTSAQMEEMRKAATAPNRYRNEKIWTLLVADAIDRSADPSKMMEWLCGRPVQAPSPLAVRFEAQPISPRFGKAVASAPAGPSDGNTKLDLAVGHIRRRAGTAGGIEYGPHVEDSWVCFVEAKCLADCSHDVSYDPLRDQLARVIENLLCFQGDGQFPEQLYFTLLLTTQ